MSIFDRWIGWPLDSPLRSSPEEPTREGVTPAPSPTGDRPITTRSDIDWKTDANPESDAVVEACMEWLKRALLEAPGRVVERASSEVDERHPLIAILDTPNKQMSWDDLYTMWFEEGAYNGPGYLRKDREDGLRLSGLSLLPSHTVSPRVLTNSLGYVDFYRYYHNQPGRGRRYDVILPEDMVRWVWSYAHGDPRRARTPFKAGSLDIFAHQELRLLVALLARNSPRTGPIIGLGGQSTAAQAEALRDHLAETFGGDKRYMAGILPAIVPGEVTQGGLGQSFREMQVRDLFRQMEEAISSLLGVPAALVGLGAGLDRSTFNNIHEARQYGYENGVLPLSRRFANIITRDLLWAEFDPERRLRFEFDYSQVRALRENEDSRQARLRDNFTAGIMSINEVRSELNLEELPDDTDRLATVSYPMLAGVSGGVVTVNEARASLDLPPVAGGDDLRVPGVPGGQQQLALATAVTRTRTYQTEELAAALKRLHDARTAALATPMRDALIVAAERAVAQAAAAVSAGGAIPEAAALYASFGDDLAALTVPAAETTAEGVAAAINASGVLPEAVTVTEATSLLVREAALARAAEIANTRVERWQAHVQNGLAAGRTQAEIADDIRETLGGEDYAGQADVIARTETTFAQTETAAAAYAEQGVREVQIIDGINDDICAAANGQVWTIEQWAANPVGHPACTRSAEPII